MSSAFKYTGQPEGMTILYLTDGSTLAAYGDCTGVVADSIFHGKGHAVHDSTGAKIMVNPAHIIGAGYQPEKTGDGGGS